MKDLTVRELYEMLEPLLDEYGEMEVVVSYDSGVVVTPIKDTLPHVRAKDVVLEGY